MFEDIDKIYLRKDTLTNVYYYMRPSIVVEVNEDEGTVGVVDKVGKTVRRDANAVPIIFPFFGQGHGEYKLPEVGDRGILLFFGPGKAGCIGFIPYNYKYQITGMSDFTKLRKIYKGEMCWRTTAGSEIYLNNKGTIQFTIYNPNDKAVEYYVKTFGKVYDSSGSETKSSSSVSFVEKYVNNVNSNQYSLDIDGNFEYKGPLSNNTPTIILTLDKNGNLTATSKGNLIFTTSGSDKKITLNFGSAKIDIESGKITISDGTNSIEMNGSTIKAGGSNELALKSELSSLISTFNSHLHPTPAGPSSVPVTPATPPVGTAILKGS